MTRQIRIATTRRRAKPVGCCRIGLPARARAVRAGIEQGPVRRRAARDRTDAQRFRRQAFRLQPFPDAQKCRDDLKAGRAALGSASKYQSVFAPASASTSTCRVGSCRSWPVSDSCLAREALLHAAIIGRVGGRGAGAIPQIRRPPGTLPWRPASQWRCAACRGCSNLLPPRPD